MANSCLGWTFLNEKQACSLLGQTWGPRTDLTDRIHLYSCCFVFLSKGPHNLRHHLQPSWTLRCQMQSPTSYFYSSFAKSCYRRHYRPTVLCNWLSFLLRSKVLFLSKHTLLCNHRYLRKLQVVRTRLLLFIDHGGTQSSKWQFCSKCCCWCTCTTGFPRCFRKTWECSECKFCLLVEGRTSTLPNKSANTALSSVCWLSLLTLHLSNLWWCSFDRRLVCRRTLCNQWILRARYVLTLLLNSGLECLLNCARHPLVLRTLSDLLKWWIWVGPICQSSENH